MNVLIYRYILNEISKPNCKHFNNYNNEQLSNTYLPSDYEHIESYDMNANVHT